MSIEMQQYAFYILFYTFRVPKNPSSGVDKTVVTATGTSHMIVQLPHSNVAKLGLVINVSWKYNRQKSKLQSPKVTKNIINKNYCITP